jgi:drug/metabolite transporter (DMT)-like permease
VAVFLGWALASEAVTARTLVAAAIIVAAVALIIRHGARRRAASTEENIIPLRAEGGRR